jgi:hypothetical protein
LPVANSWIGDDKSPDELLLSFLLHHHNYSPLIKSLPSPKAGRLFLDAETN